MEEDHEQSHHVRMSNTGLAVHGPRGLGMTNSTFQAPAYQLYFAIKRIRVLKETIEGGHK